MLNTPELESEIAAVVASEAYSLSVAVEAILESLPRTIREMVQTSP